MPQLFQPSTLLGVKLAVIAIACALVGIVLYGMVWLPAGGASIDAMNAQPIPFSHKHHVGDVGLDCRFCHVTVESSSSPGMPSAQVCLTCHSQLFADQAIFEPLRRSLAGHQPIAWTHVNRLPDYVYFDHSVHVAKGVACMECHGRLDQMPLVAKPQSMTMKWCVACHENPAPHLGPAADVFRMPAGRLSAAEVESVDRLLRLERRQRLTDCSTCHR
jgi:Cytochrome c7 and related cytochrome c